MTFGLFPLIPAYGRQYKNRAELIKDFEANKDFSTPFGQYVNKEQLTEYKKISFRFGKNHNKAFIYTVGEK